VIGFDRLSRAHTEGRIAANRASPGSRSGRASNTSRSHCAPRDLARARRETGESLSRFAAASGSRARGAAARCTVEDFFNRTRAAARRFGFAHEVLDAADIRRRFPVFKVKDDEQGYFEPAAGLVRPEACVRTQLALAARLGADLHAASAWTASRSAATRWS
jgi:sarcosine oxidase